MKTPLKTQNLPQEEKLVNCINWFEIPAISFDRAVKFYSSIFNFEFETNEMNGYSMAFFPSNSGVSGAIICGEGSVPSDKGPLLYLNGGEDLEHVLSRVEQAGGRVIMTKQMINPTAGYFALFIDTEGNRLALHSKS